MEEFVQLKLETYLSIANKISEQYKTIASLTEDLNDEREEKEMVIAKANETAKKLHKAIMENNLLTYKFKECPLEKLSNPNSFDFGYTFKNEMEEVGITTEEMIDYLKKRYEEVMDNE